MIHITIATKQAVAAVGWLEMLTKMLPLVQTLAVVGGVFVAARGLSTWRHQRVGTRKLELAEEALKSFAKVQDTLFEISNGFVWAGESAEIANNFLKDFERDEAKRLAAVAAPLARSVKHSEFLNNFFEQKYVVQAYFGLDARDHYDTIRSILIEIQTASNMLMDRNPRTVEFEDSGTRDLYHNLSKKISMGSIESHPLHLKTVDTVNKATSLFSSYLAERQNRSTYLSRLWK